jgi:hypothetical protein
LAEAGRFWLSSTPEQCVADWGVSYPLTVEWARFRTRDTGAEFLHLNTQYEDGPDGIMKTTIAACRGSGHGYVIEWWVVKPTIVANIAEGGVLRAWQGT